MQGKVALNLAQGVVTSCNGCKIVCFPVRPGLYVKNIPLIQFACIRLTVPTSGLQVRQIVLMNVIYL